jgi:hypothetical protein
MQKIPTLGFLESKLLCIIAQRHNLLAGSFRYPSFRGDF